MYNLETMIMSTQAIKNIKKKLKDPSNIGIYNVIDTWRAYVVLKTGRNVILHYLYDKPYIMITDFALRISILYGSSNEKGIIDRAQIMSYTDPNGKHNSYDAIEKILRDEGDKYDSIYKFEEPIVFENSTNIGLMYAQDSDYKDQFVELTEGMVRVLNRMYNIVSKLKYDRDYIDIAI